MRFQQPRDVLLPLSGVFIAILLAAGLAKASISGMPVERGDLLALVAYGVFMGLLASVPFPDRAGLVFATGMVVAKATVTVGDAWLGRGWPSMALTAVMGGLASMTVARYSRRRDGGRAEPPSAATTSAVERT